MASCDSCQGFLKTHGDLWDVLALMSTIICGYYALVILWYIVCKIFDCLRMSCCFSSPTCYSGKVVWVIGGSSGIGEECVKTFAAHGARVALSARRQAQLEEVAAACGSGAETLVLPVPKDEKDPWASLYAQLKSKWGVPDVVVLSSGAGSWRYLHTQDVDDIDRGLSAPFFVSAQVCRVVIPDMLRNKSKNYQILGLQSPVAYFPWPACAMYASNRFALRGLMLSLRQDLHSSNIAVVPVVVGESNTGYWAANPGSRQYVPVISRIIPTYSSADVAQIVFRTAALGKTSPVHENFQIALLIWMQDLLPATMAWTLRWCRSEVPDEAASAENEPVNLAALPPQDERDDATGAANQPANTQ